KALLIVGPTTPFTEDELRKINRYVMGGGSLAVIGGATKVTLEQEISAAPATTQLNQLLKGWGVELGTGIVADAQCGRASMRAQFGMQLAVRHPPIPVLSFDEAQSSHPATFRLDSVHMPFVSPLTVKDPGSNAFRITTLASSTESSWLLTGDSVDLAP